MKMNANQGTSRCDAQATPSAWEMTPAKLPFKQWKLREGERLYNKGAQQLSNTELLAYIVRDVAIAERLMDHFGTLEGIADASVDELQQVSGVGEALAETIVSALELGRRAIRRNNDFYTLSSPQAVHEMLRDEMKILKQEEMKALLLDTRNNVRKTVTVCRGTLDSAEVHPRDVFREAIKANAKSIIIVHNHPSGSTNPSPDDCRITKKLVEAGKIISIEVIDHIVIAGETYFSFKEEGMLS